MNQQLFDTKKVSYTWVGGTPTTETTRFVGSLYEVSETRATSHIFMGDTRIASITNEVLKYYHADHLGGTNLVTDEDGVVKHLVEYDPWGKASRDELFGSPDEAAWHLFTGKQLDKESELYYYGARYYNPVLGRFISPDTIVPYPDDPQSFNRYSYARNNPINIIDPSGHSFFSILFKAFSDSLGSFLGGTTGSTIGAFVGSIIMPGVGTVVGAYIGASLGSGIGQTVQHGGEWSTNIGNSFISTAETFAVAGAGFVVGGPVGAVAAVVGFNMGMTAARGGSLEDVAISGIVTTAYAVASVAYYNAVGGKVIQKGVEIHNAIKAGAVQPIGTENNTRSKSLNADQGENASNQQALRLKPNYDVEGRIVSYDLVPEESGLNSPNFIGNSSGQIFPVPQGATGPIPVMNNAGKQTGIAFTGGQGGANGQVSTIRIMNPRGAIGNSPAYPNGYVTYGNNSVPPQNVNPYTGRTGTREELHFPLNQ